MLQLTRSGGLMRLALRGRPIACLHTSPRAAGGHHDLWYGPEKCAGREIVGYGHNGEPTYTDRLDYWYPAIRFRKPDDTYRALHEKEKADWKSLTLEDKKQLYRYSYRQTRAEFFAPTGYWKPITSLVLYGITLGLSMTFFVHQFMMPPPPPTFTPEYKEAMLQRMIDLRSEPITGVASKWDYEKNTWK